jgi:hypothetical protein
MIVLWMDVVWFLAQISDQESLSVTAKRWADVTWLISRSKGQGKIYQAHTT